MAEVKETHMLILGGTGFLGRQIAAAAVSEGYRVSSFARTKPRTTGVESAVIEFASGTVEQKVIRAPLAVDVIVNALAGYGRNGEDEAEIRRVNFEIPGAIADYYFALSASQRPMLFLNVDTALRPGVSAYSKSKAELRSKLETWAQQGEAAVGLRLDQFYGPGDASSKFVTMIVEKFLAKVEAIPLSSGTQTRRFLYAADAVRVLIGVVGRVRAAELKPSAESAAILPDLGVASTVRDVVLRAQLLCAAQATRLDFGSLRDRGIETDDRRVPSGFEFLEKGPFVGIDEGLGKVIEHERIK